ncbi:hypothetical protein [Paraburkholderia youngii]|uniref:hypothetical protein n=1 Tax=Paraburkholderia youngii TaxID=2782701 RepID=UPI003D1C0D0E
MNTQHQPEVVASATADTQAAPHRIAIVVGGDSGMGARLSLLRAIRESDLAGRVVLVDEESFGRLPASHEARQAVSDAAFARAGDVALAQAALGVLVDPLAAPFKLASPREPRELTQSDNDRLEAARLKRERKAARLRVAWALS